MPISPLAEGSEIALVVVEEVRRRICLPNFINGIYGVVPLTEEI